MLLFNIVKNFGRSKIRNYGKIAANQRYQIGKNFNLCNIQEKKLIRLTGVKTNNDIKRYYSVGPDEPSQQEQLPVLLPPLTNDEIHILPNVFKAFTSAYYLHGVIKSRLDSEFNMPEFIEGSKQAVVVVSEALAREDYDSLSELVDSKVINELRNKISTLTQEQKNLIAIRLDDIYGSFPHSIRVFDSSDDGEKTFAEISMVYYSLRGLRELREQNIVPPLEMGLMPEYQDKIFLSNYKFRRDYTNGNTEPWIVSMCNQMMLIAA
ncbi:hypothetical protein PV325_009391 [Microctonus aethiopoides]|uniref:Tim44-like domain-containing protein n=1 Tax=Microctonus aethiopoides TaxID=144406 RepID=A0AA39FQD7_9HYME|nr:hypothetical protein PV325_009391 [Microctonus aethiopoides]KAK0173570.1 hypothetical protein PV328_006746 [Microctonus aethiopoides]